MVKIYSLSTCPWCKRLKRYFDDQGIVYQSVEVDTLAPLPREEALREVEELAGERVFPVAVVCGQAIVGYQPDKVAEALTCAQ